MAARRSTDVIAYRNLTPFESLEALSGESRSALAEFRAGLNIGEEVDLSGPWWGVVVFATRNFRRCDSRAEAVSVALDLARERSVAAWLEENGHKGAQLLGDFSKAAGA